ncbi:PITH domain-containing protein CG6153-like isoform X1 [Centruroides sculpturatus]|uniref:PITH domain-containing protein CG6153-like isoform X1 n=2 Tax=Centruroides sculpturatus TaxID=218467 RepID=UPI000C6EFC47|nr:PITH domain-containing protein CG6153-like isoform X1 [Centruroides sculpturatus]
MAGHRHHAGCEHSSADSSPELGIEYSLFNKIDIDHVECLNEEVDGSGKYIFKPWEKRLDLEKYVDSDVDEELLFNIPFTGNVKLKGIIVIGGENGSHPSKMRLFKNRPHLSFDDVGATPDQEFELYPDPTGTLEYSTKIVKFSSMYYLSIHFPKNFGSDKTRIYYIGLRGEFSEAQRQEVAICSYEAAPNPADHKTTLFENVSREVL